MLQGAISAVSKQKESVSARPTDCNWQFADMKVDLTYMEHLETFKTFFSKFH